MNVINFQNHIQFSEGRHSLQVQWHKMQSCARRVNYKLIQESSEISEITLYNLPPAIYIIQITDFNNKTQIIKYAKIKNN